MTLSELIIELIKVVIHHALHGEAWSNLGYRILDVLNPLWAVTLAILSIVQWDDLVL